MIIYCKILIVNIFHYIFLIDRSITLSNEIPFDPRRTFTNKQAIVTTIFDFTKIVFTHSSYHIIYGNVHLIYTIKDFSSTLIFPH